MSDWLTKDKTYVWHPFTQMKTAPQPLEVVKAAGTWLYTADGKKYLDINSSWWVNVHGHGHPHIAEAIGKQFMEVDHVIFAGATHHRAIELSERICGILPPAFQKVFFSDDGSTAVEVALKMAFQYWYNREEPRRRVLAIDGAYHGDTFGAMSVGQRGYFNRPFEHLFFDVDFLDFPELEKEQLVLQQAEDLLASNEFAAIIVEPLVQGSAGMRMYRVELLDALVACAKKYGVLVIFDEVMTGWGRTGKLFAMNHGTQIPDIVCLSKGLTGGTLPLGLTVATNELYNAFLADETAKALLHGHSYTGNALACAAACASLDIFALPETTEHIERLCEWNKRLADQLKGHPKLRDVRQCGTILAVELEIGEGSSYYASIRDTAYTYFLDQGILLRPLGNVLFINPPYCISEEEHTLFADSLIRFIEEQG